MKSAFKSKEEELKKKPEDTDIKEIIEKYELEKTASLKNKQTSIESKLELEHEERENTLKWQVDKLNRELTEERVKLNSITV